MARKSPISRLEAEVKGTDFFHVIIETPKGSRNKYKYEPKLDLFTLHKVLPAGAVFPFDFGFIAATTGQDGDPLDVLVFMDEPAFTGCMVEVRMIGVIEAEQTEKGETMRNDRLIGVAARSHNHSEIQSLKEIDESLVHEIQHFFISYDAIEGKEFKPIGVHGSNRAQQLIEEGIKLYEKEAEEK